MVSTQVKTVAERFLFPATFVALIGFILAIVCILSDPAGPGVLLLVISAAGVVLGISLMTGLSTGYEFDPESRKIFFRLSWLFVQRRTLVASMQDVAGFSVTGIHNQARVHSWWSYKVVMLLKSGRMIAVSQKSDKSVHSMNRLAEKLAATMGCEYFPGQQEKTVHAAIAGDRPVLEYQDWQFVDLINEFWADILLSLLFFGAILSLIVALVVVAA